MSNLTEFLLERIAEDEAATAPYVESGGRARRWVAARVLAECKAKRTIVAEHQPWPKELAGYCAAHDGRYLVDQCPTLLALAAVYADHPDHEGWKQ